MGGRTKATNDLGGLATESRQGRIRRRRLTDRTARFGGRRASIQIEGFTPGRGIGREIRLVRRRGRRNAGPSRIQIEARQGIGEIAGLRGRQATGRTSRLRLGRGRRTGSEGGEGIVLQRNMRGRRHRRLGLAEWVEGEVERIIERGERLQRGLAVPSLSDDRGRLGNEGGAEQAEGVVRVTGGIRRRAGGGRKIELQFRAGHRGLGRTILPGPCGIGNHALKDVLQRVGSRCRSSGTRGGDEVLQRRGCAREYGLSGRIFAHAEDRSALGTSHLDAASGDFLVADLETRLAARALDDHRWGCGEYGC